MKDPLGSLAAEVEAEARRLRLEVDVQAYEAAGRSPFAPIVCAGNPAARVCVVGRDLGRHEVRFGQPLVGLAGQAVRRGVLEAAGRSAHPGDVLRESALEHVFLTNLVPYKPVGNRAYPVRIRERFRPFLERLLACYWRGDVVLPLGAEAFAWFRPYAAEPLGEAWTQADRFACDVSCRLEVRCDRQRVSRALEVCPLPHPSPANARWKGKFAGLLAKRLEVLR